jgi:hypothetical protein
MDRRKQRKKDRKKCRIQKFAKEIQPKWFKSKLEKGTYSIK